MRKSLSTQRRRPLRAATCAAVVLAVAALLVLTGCSAKKNTAYSRNYQAFITRYNVYYNGDQHFRETLRDMERSYEDDYSQRLFLHPAEAKEHPKSPQPSGNFDRSIEKAQKAIQLHSVKKRPKRKGGKNSPEQKAWLKRSEYNPFLHNAWMMMGRSQYYNGDFAGAASTFMYTAKNFTWLPRTVTEARLWEALSYCALDWLYEAENIVSRIKPEQLDTKTLRGLYAFVRADLLVRQRNYEEAVPALREALGYASGWSQKVRLNFLLGQVLSQLGRKQEAYEAFKRAGSNVNASYRTKLNARIKQSEVYMGSDIEPEVKALRRMTRYDRNADYLDQIYYAIGNLYLSRGDTLQAIENYKLAAEKSTRSGIDKAINNITLGGLYFDRRQYDLAQPCYAEGVPPLPDDYPDRARLKRRSDVLDELAVYSQNVQLQDSLLRLADMDSTERMAVINGIIEALKKKEKEDEDAARLEEMRALQEGRDNGLRDNGQSAPSTFQMSTDNSWYFYNQQALSAGKADFQRRWGARKLEDNWRRRNKATFSFDDEPTDDDEEEGEEGGDGETSEEEQAAKEQAERASDPHFPEYYLAQIPSTPEERAVSDDIIQEGLYNMGVILKNKLEDVPAAAAEFNSLLTRYPDNVYRLDTYYNLYLMYMQAGQPDTAEHWRQMILTEFPESPYGVALLNPDYIESLRRMALVEEATYRQAFDDYMNNRNAAVHAAYETMEADYPLSKLMPKFMFLHALAYVTENNADDFGRVLREMLDRFPQTDMTPIASAYVKDLAAGRKLNSTSSNTRGMLWDTRLLLPDDTTRAAADSLGGPVEFTLAPDSPHMLLLLYEQLGSAGVIPNALLYNVARHNFMTYTVRDFDLDTYSFPPLGILAVKGLASESEANYYRSELMADERAGVPADLVRPVVISESNFDAMLRGGASFEEYFRFMGDTVTAAVHESVLPPDEYEPQQEMYDALRQAEQAEAEPDESVSDEPVSDEPEFDIPEPETSAQPETPAEPVKPAESQKPAEPQKPAVPLKPAEPQKPAEPMPAPLPPDTGSEGPDSLLDDD